MPVKEPFSQQTASRRRAEALVLGLVITAVLILILVRSGSDAVGASSGGESSGPPAASTANGTLSLENLSARQSDGSAIVSVDIRWSGGFPGIRSCIVVAQDSSGREVGRHEDLVAALSEVEGVPFGRMEIDGPIDQLTAECGERLDVGTPYEYDIDVTDESLSDTQASVTFDARWRGPAQAGAVTCTLVGLDTSGAIVGEHSFNLMLLEGSGEGLQADTPTSGAAVSTRLTCEPF